MIALLASVLGTALLGSPHCAGMCGGFVVFYSGQAPDRARRWLAHAAYSVGRLVSYAALGALAGALGAGVERLGAAAGLARAAAVGAGALMVLWGGAALLRALGARLPELPLPAGGPRPVAGALRALREQPAAARALALGLLSTLLPCGFLYAYVAVAAGTGSAALGALTLTAFWLGTLPVMTGLGLVAQRAFGPLRRYLPVATATVLIAVGALMVAGRLQPGGLPGHPACCDKPVH
ncbi:MAG TPA: sulfite exporter TauE/SafE family protein [Candidatus Saccharimonadales bacterium]|nr:sulfite exporter TauE/SafE family protein [Candidatus Saccharimonadales bacterium]